ncbi:uncharacterized protein LOC133692582 isoform X2 [Populus nigra]|uniref:uncharacterized protein LOC133692582 isoform X2 n=2 Tax=Populus nigra TaxID=3691 RepID=UPI002B2654C9|nr:uncharacterized protein LOC133692582 isoform X2 [Populus nigra]
MDFKRARLPSMWSQLALILWYSEFILSALSYSSDFGIIEVLCLGKSLASILLMLLHAGNSLQGCWCVAYVSPIWFLNCWEVWFLKGALSIDQHSYSAPFEKNLPVSMESNGNGASIDGVLLLFETGKIEFGEPGANGRHSFYQLIHQVISCSIMHLVEVKLGHCIPILIFKNQFWNSNDSLFLKFIFFKSMYTFISLLDVFIQNLSLFPRTYPVLVNLIILMLMMHMHLNNMSFFYVARSLVLHFGWFLIE